MEHEKALEILKFNIAFGNLGHIDIHALDIAIQALEKQIPKNPTPHKVKAEKIKIGNGNWCKGTTVYKCPCCDTFISKIYDYCHKCGQALDWSDTE